MDAQTREEVIQMENQQAQTTADRHHAFAVLLSTVPSLSCMGAADLIDALPTSECSLQAQPRWNPAGFDVICLAHRETIHSRTA